MAVIFLSSLLIRFILFQFPGYKNDLQTFAAWLYAAYNSGIRIFYEATPCDYPPLNVYFFWIFGGIAKYFSMFGTNSIVYVIKLIPSVFDIATSYLIFYFIRSRLSFKESLLASGFYAFNPAILFNSSVWGQYDSIYTFFLVLSLVLLIESRLKLSISAFAFAILTKPQSIAVAPLVIFLVFKRYGLRGILTSMIVGALVVLVVVAPFQWDNPATFLYNIYAGGYGEYPYTSVNAFNIWAFHGFWQFDGQMLLFLSMYTIGWILFGLIIFLALYFIEKRLYDPGDMIVLFSAFILLLGFFMLPTRIHERYIFPALSILALMSPFNKQLRIVYGLLSFTLFINLIYILDSLNYDKLIPFGDPVVISISLVNLSVFFYILFLTWKGLRDKNFIRSCNSS